MVLHKANALGATELNYLENRFRNYAVEAGKDTKNRNNPPVGSIGGVNIEIEMDPFMEEVFQILKLLRYRIFEKDEPQKAKTEVTSDGIMLFMQRKGREPERTIDVKCVLKDGKYTLLKGSIVAMVQTGSCDKAIKDKRQAEADKIDPDGLLLEDIEFTSPSGASQFANYGNSNGKLDLKNEDGRPLKELLEE